MLINFYSSCLLEKSTRLFSLQIPMLTIIFINFVFFILIVTAHLKCCRKNSVKINISGESTARKNHRVLVIIMVCLLNMGLSGIVEFLIDISTNLQIKLIFGTLFSVIIVIESFLVFGASLFLSRDKN